MTTGSFATLRWFGNRLDVSEKKDVTQYADDHTAAAMMNTFVKLPVDATT